MEHLLVYLLSLWLLVCFSLVTFTRPTLDAFRMMFITGWMRTPCLVALVMGVLFIVAAFYSPCHFWIPFIVGLIAIAKGVYFLVAPIERLEVLFRWVFQEMSEEFIRGWGALVLIVITVLLTKIA